MSRRSENEKKNEFDLFAAPAPKHHHASALNNGTPAGPIGPSGPNYSGGPSGPIGPSGPNYSGGPSGPIGPSGPNYSGGPSGPIGPSGPVSSNPSAPQKRRRCISDEDMQLLK
ncbi:MAG: hypothetical protein WCS73_03395 [Lentisphaeria bacterium]